MMPKLLIVEDDETIRTQMKWALAKDYEIHLAGDRATACELIRSEKPSIVTLDLGLPPRPGETEEGFLTLKDIKEFDPLAKVIVVTGQDEKENAMKAIGLGAYDFFCKPIQIDELKVVLGRATYLSNLEQEYQDLQHRYQTDSFEGMTGTSPQMQDVYTSIRKVATTDAPALIIGESGTGKELVAKAIHKVSSRRVNPFIVINCGAIPENLLESELFGHEKGAFTGAHIQRKGRFEMADGGSLFLDEIGELSPALQVKLLRFLQEHKIERVGGREEIPLNVRLMAATNRDLKEEMKTGNFREDLYYRLGVVVVSLPPLKEREGDVIVIATSLLHRYARENRKRIHGFSHQAIHAMDTYTWPGNIRELENKIKRAVIMAEGPRLTPMDLELGTEYDKYEGRSLKEAREALEKELIERALRKNRGNMTKAAEDLGVSRPTLYELLDKLRIGKG